MAQNSVAILQMRRSWAPSFIHASAKKFIGGGGMIPDSNCCDRSKASCAINEIQFFQGNNKIVGEFVLDNEF